MAAPHKRWQDLSATKRLAIAAAGLVQVSLQVAALRDMRRRDARRVNGDKRVWAAASFVNFIGPLAYFAFGRKPPRGPARLAGARARLAPARRRSR